MRIERLHIDHYPLGPDYYKDKRHRIRHHPTEPAIVYNDGDHIYCTDNLVHNVAKKAEQHGLRYIWWLQNKRLIKIYED